MPQSSEASTDTPLVSFVLLAYNQEKYVREAIEGAFSQTYPNLEVVLSDDGSADSTFEIMQEMAASYAGPHRVLVNRTRQNRGVLSHLYEAVSLCSGDFVVGSAGDDISYAQRVSVLTERWLASRADALFSRFDVIDENGSTLVEGVELFPSEYDPRRYFPKGQIQQIRGVTSAYSRKVFEAIYLPEEKIMAEDFFFALMLGSRSRRVEFVDEVLVKYREHSAAAGNVSEAAIGLEAYERVVQSSSGNAVQILRYLEKAVSTGSGFDENWGESAEIDLKRLRRDIRFLEFRSRWLEAGFVSRLGAIAAARSKLHLRWLLPRLFGLKGLALLKQLRPR